MSHRPESLISLRFASNPLRNPLRSTVLYISISSCSALPSTTQRSSRLKRLYTNLSYSISSFRLTKRVKETHNGEVLSLCRHVSSPKPCIRFRKPFLLWVCSNAMSYECRRGPCVFRTSLKRMSQVPVCSGQALRECHRSLFVQDKP
jgi:hypothetical protein